MNKFLNLDYYKSRSIYIPPTYLPVKERQLNNYVGLIELCNSPYGKTIYDSFLLDNDYEYIRDIIKIHGFFSEKFICERLKEQIKKRIINENLVSIFNLYTDRYRYKTEKSFKRNFVNDVSRDLYMVLLYNLNDELVYKNLNLWIELKSVPHSCDLCGNVYVPIKFPDWVYYGSSANINICYECPIDECCSEDSAVKLITSLVNKCKFIPRSSFNPILRSFSSRISSEDWAEVCSTIFKLGIDGNARLGKKNRITDLFGDWFVALVRSGVLKDNVIKGSRGWKCLADSGNVCNSLDEQYIDNWLYHHRIKVVKEPFYPKHYKHNPNGKKRADWLMGDIYIEYFGLEGDENYDERTLEKLYLASELGFQILSIYPKDLNNLDAVFQPWIGF